MFDKVTSGDGAYGTTQTNWISAHPLISTSLQRTIEKVARPHLVSGAGNRKSHFVAADNAGGDFVIEANYNTIGLILKHALGAASTSAGTPNTHTYVLAADLPDNGLTATVIRGSGSTGETFDGVRLNSLTMACAAGEVMTLTGDVIAETSNVDTTDGSETRAAKATLIGGIVDAPVLHHHCGTLVFDGETLNVKSMSLTLSNSLDRRQFLGSKLTKDPLRTDFMSVEVAFEIDVNDTLYGKYVRGDESDATLTFDNGGAGAAEREMAFTFQNAYLSACTDPVNSAGLLSQSITLICQSDGTNHGLSIAVKNQGGSGGEDMST
jgi:hypothetical protein